MYCSYNYDFEKVRAVNLFSWEASKMTNGFQLQLSNSYGASHCYYGKILKVKDFDFN